MKFLDILGTIGKAVASVISPDSSLLGNALRGQTINEGLPRFGGTPIKKPTLSPLDPTIVSPLPRTSPTPEPTWGIIPTAAPTIAPTPAPSDLQALIKKAYQRYNGGTTPLASMSAELADAGQGLKDPLIAAILGMKESGGGSRMKYTNNPLNILAEGRYNYPTLQSNINGGPGDDRQSFKELMAGNTYNTYKNSGNLADFFGTYTPIYDANGVRNTNPSIEDQIKLYNELKSQYFGQ